MNTPTSPDPDKLLILVIEHLSRLRTELQLVQYAKTTKQVRQENYALEAEELSSALREDLDALLDSRVNPDSEIDCFPDKVSLGTAMLQIDKIYRLLGYLNQVHKIPSKELGLTDLVHFAPKKTALRQAKSFDDTQLIEQATLQAAEDTQKILNAVLRWLRKERKIHPSTEKGIIEVFLVIAKFLYAEETSPLTAA